MRWIVLFIALCMLTGMIFAARQCHADDQPAGRVIKHGDVTTYYAADGTIVATEHDGILTIYSPDGDVLGRFVLNRDPEDYQPPLPFGETR